MDDKTVNGMDTQNVLDDTEQTIDKLIKKKRLWTGIAVFWFIVWLLIIMYMIFYGKSYQDTIRPPVTTSEPVTGQTITPAPTIEPTPKVESVSVQEYDIKFDKLSPKYTGKLTDEYGGLRLDAVESYGRKCRITYKIKAGDDNFTAKRTDDSELFTSSDKLFKSFTGTSMVIVDAGDTAEIFKKLTEGLPTDKGICIVVERDRPKYIDPKEIKGVGVIVSDTDSISNGVSTLEKKINSLKDNGLQDDLYTVAYLSLREYADLVGKCFNTKGYIVSSTGEGDVLFQKTPDGGVSIKADDLKDGDTLVFFSLDRFLFTKRTAAIYSKILQNDYSEIYKVFDKDR